MGVAERIVAQADRLTATERRIAEVLTAEPQIIAFGTVALVAKEAGTSGPSVVRLAVKLGYAGFVDLQADVQREVARRLGPARDRIRQQPPVDLLDHVAAAESDNVMRTLGGISAEVFDRAITRLSDETRSVWVLPGDVTGPIGQSLAVPLGQLRERVTLLSGSGVTASRMMGGFRTGDVVVSIDIRRYERWLVDLSRWSVAQGASLIALTDSPLSPLASGASETFFIAAQGVGPFDSMTGGMALSNALVAGVAARLRSSAVDRLDAIEAAWTATTALTAEPNGSAGTTVPPGTKLRQSKSVVPT
jgi:DNA-binding MurR/RpiR family transcriptional regulator